MTFSAISDADDAAGDEGPEIQAEQVDLDKANYGDSFKGTIKLQVRYLLTVRCLYCQGLLLYSAR